jgi:N-acetylglucosamine-6-sulfatase
VVAALHCRPQPSARRRASRLAVALALAVLGAWLGLAATVGAGALAGGTGGTGPPAPQARPNVVVIETDDQTLESIKVMDTVRRRIGDKGVTFANSFVSFSLCCPSRATFLTGQYAHNHGVRGNSPRTGGFSTFERLHGDDNLAVWLRRAGYRTALVGKYMNGYGRPDPTLVPPGWTEWYAAVGAETTAQAVYDYRLNENGSLVRYGTAPEDFKQDVLTEHAVDFIDRRAPQRRPFFLWLSYTAPHTTGSASPSPQPPFDCQQAAQPAARDADAFDAEPLPAPPSFNEADISDKPAWLRAQPLLGSGRIEGIARRYRCRLESLLSVDRGAGRVIEALLRSRELSSTYVVFTSDNGLLQGEHRRPGDKSTPYEESIRVPLVIRGPGIPRGRTARELAVNADLAPTIVRATGAVPGSAMDGRSLLGAARHPNRETGRELAIEAYPFHGIPGFRGLRNWRYLYARYRSGEEELYDLARDPYQLENAAADPAYEEVRSLLARRLQRLERCRGSGCRTTPRVGLRLGYRSGRARGQPCARNPIRARVVGAGARNVLEAAFGVGGRPVAADSEAPFAQLLSPARGRIRVRARVSMLDGRRLTLARAVRACG